MRMKKLVPMSWRYRIADMRGRGVYGDYADEYRCIFIHIPKTAGTSVVRALFGSESRHIPWQEYQQTNRNKFSEYFKFAFVRNPWDRLLSAYIFLRRGGMNTADATWAERHLARFPDFESFVHEWVSPDNIASWVHFIPQYKWIYDDQGSLQMDFVGRMESITEDFQVVAKRLGTNVELPVTNRTRTEHYSGSYTDEMADSVGRVFEHDARLFGYEFKRKQSYRFKSSLGSTRECS